MKRIHIFLSVLLFLFLFTYPPSFAQGIARSKGLGLRLSFWNITGRSTRISVLDEAGQAKVDLSGAGIGFYFFSRAFHNWFFELDLSAIGGVQSEINGAAGTEIDVEAIIPLLLGLRYDIFATRLPGSLHPYLSGGGGPYWASTIQTKNQITGTEETVESELDYGYYFGGGMNWVLTSWFAFNFDLKYHFIEFESGKNYNGFQFGTGFSVMWGRKREVFALKDVKLIVKEIYPAYQQFYNNYPLALVTVKNLIGYPIEVNVRCNIKRYSAKPKDSGFVRVARSETKDIPVTAFFGKRLRDLSRRETAIMDLQIEVRAGATYKKDFSAEITIHGRNAWNGDVDKLSFFLTPEDKNILRLSRKISEKISPGEQNEAGNFNLAKQIFTELSNRRIRYFSDPNIPYYKDDRVQFAGETLKRKKGDCDDLVVLYASLLESAGIRTAFVEVRDPEKEIAHLYLLFDSGLPASEGYLISSNDKRYLLRKNSVGKDRIWIPVETTLIREGFAVAWDAGAIAYLREAVLRNGIADGWVKIIDVE